MGKIMEQPHKSLEILAQVWGSVLFAYKTFFFLKMRHLWCHPELK